MISQVSIVKCSSYDRAEVDKGVRRSVELLGGIKKFIKPDARVLVKPNLLMAKEPEFGIDTHPEVLRAVVKILKDINCKIFIGDGPSVWGNQAEHVDEVYERSGTKKISEEEGVELVKFDRKRWRGKFPLTTWLDNCDYLISVPKFKTHDLTILTGAIKNLFGLVWGTYKTELHKKYFNAEDFSKMLVDIYEEARPVLTIVDGIVAMEGEGPGTSGKLRNVDLVLASSDVVALDSVLSIIMGLVPEQILTTKEAAQRKLGAMDLNSIEILGEGIKNIPIKPFILPATTIKYRIPQPLVNIAKNFIKFYPKINRKMCNLCGACLKACPNKVITIKFGSIKIDYSKCISCFCCQEVCPNSAIKIKKSILAKMIGL